MRIRQIKPSWFLDKELRRGVNADAREFYVGLWMIADDAGWFTWDVERIAAELYPYETTNRREKNVWRWSQALALLNEQSPHLRVYTCGHAQVPKMPAHQRIAGKQAVTTRDKHHLECRNADSYMWLTVATHPGEPTLATDSRNRLRKEVGKEVGNGTERNGTPSRARAPEGAARSEWQSRVPREKVGLA